MRRCLLVVTLTVVAVAACGDNTKKPPVDEGPGPVEISCRVLPPSQNTCDVTAGNATMLLQGTVLTPTTVYKGGEVAVDATGRISCVGCNCGTGGETIITCPDAAISPGLINTHDHITYTHNNPYVASTERYDDRQQWRIGKNGHYAIPYDSGAKPDQVRWGELRFLMGGASSARVAKPDCSATSTRRRTRRGWATGRSTSTRSRSTTRTGSSGPPTATTERHPRCRRRWRTSARTSRTPPRGSTPRRTTNSCASHRTPTTRWPPVCRITCCSQRRR
jgi:hypothetical protein